jgi:hypothetical protein
MFFFIFLLDDRRIRIRIWGDPKTHGSTYPDPHHWLVVPLTTYIIVSPIPECLYCPCSVLSQSNLLPSMALIEKWRKEGSNPTLLLTPSKNNRKKRRPVPTLTPKVVFFFFFLLLRCQSSCNNSTLGKPVYKSPKNICSVCSD